MVIIGFLVLLLAAELLLRVYHHHTIRATLPAELRAETRELAWADIENKYRIVCFGDSITYGEDLSSLQSYPAVLTTLLKDACPDLEVVVINAGMRGHTSVQGLSRLERDVLWYRPHVVLSAFGVNDANLGHWPLDPLRERRECGDSSLVGRLLPVLRQSHLWLTLRGRTRRLLRRLGWQYRPVPQTDSELQPRVSRRGFEVAQNLLATRIKRDGSQTLYMMTTTPVTDAFRPELDNETRQWQLRIHAEYNDIVREVATRHGAYLLDLTGIFAVQEPLRRDALVSADGVHLTAAGERLVAQSVMQVLEQHGLPGSEPYQRR
jgi:lysophospholipase L1-like esterase